MRVELKAKSCLDNASAYIAGRLVRLPFLAGGADTISVRTIRQVR